MKTHTKHDQTIDKLINRLDDTFYHGIGRNIEYFGKKPKQVLGEIDAYAYTVINDKSYMLIFEMKSTNRIQNYNKAKKQLRRSNAYYSKHIDKVYSFYVSNSKQGDLVIKQVRCK